MLTKFSGVESERTVSELRKGKFLYCVDQLHRAGGWNQEVPYVAVVQRPLRNVGRKNRDARAKSLFLPFFLFLPSSLLKHCCYPEFLLPWQRDVTLLPIRPIYSFFCRFRCRCRCRRRRRRRRRRCRRLALLSVSVIQGPFNLGKVLNFTSRLEKSLNSVQVLKKYLMSLLGLEKPLKFTILQTPSFFCQITRIILSRRIWPHPRCTRTCKTHWQRKNIFVHEQYFISVSLFQMLLLQLRCDCKSYPVILFAESSVEVKINCKGQGFSQ